MKAPAYRYVYYPGHLGSRPVTELTAQRGILWDANVRRVPAEPAAWLVAEGGFLFALDHDDAARELGRSKKKLAELVKTGRLHGETYHPPREGEPDVAVIVLPAGTTPTALKAELDAESSKKEKETSDE